MKKSLPNQRTALQFFSILCVMLLFSNFGWGQQVIGSFPDMDGGFENQTGTLAIGTVTSEKTSWTTTATSGIISSTGGRSGPKYVTCSQSGTTHKRLQSPTTTIPVSTYRVQFWYQGDTDGTITANNLRGGCSSADGSGGAAYSSYISANSGEVWTLFEGSVTTATGTNLTLGIGAISINNTAVFKIDDFVIYAGSAADATAPEPSTAPTIPSATAAATQQTISWTEPVTGVDGGGYMVVRSTADPTTTPNAKGIYAVGNFVAGTEKVVYLGTAYSFNDTGLSASTQYYYRIYTVDKAFNYSTAISVNGTTTAPSFAAEPTTQVSGITFSSISSTGMTINWTAGSGTNSLVVVKEGGEVNADPGDGNTLYPNTAFGSGAQLGTGNYVVYNSTSNSVSITGLLKARTYYVKVYTFNGSAGSENYLVTSPPSNSQLASPGEITSNGNSTSSSGVSYATAAAWVGGVAPTQYDNVTIVAGDIINISSTQKCYNLTINTGGKIQAPTPQTLQIYGTSILCNGTFGDASTVLLASSGTGSQLTTEFGGNLTISGTGGIYPYKIRPITGLSNIGITFDANTTVTNTTVCIQSDNTGNDNVTYTINSGKTITLGGSLSTTSSSSGVGSANTTVNVNGTLNIGGSGTLNTTVAVGKTYSVNITGAATINKLNITPAHSVQSPSITVTAPGSLTVTGTVDASKTTIIGAVTGTGTFTLNSAGTIQIAAASGLEPVAGPIRTTTRDFSTGANYSYVGEMNQISGTDLPETVNNLTIATTNSATVTLTNATNLTNKLTVTSGSLITDGKLTLKSAECCTAFVGQLADGAVTGDVTVERYIPAKRAWRALTAPVIRANNNSIYTNWQNGGTSGTSTGTGVEIWSNNSSNSSVTTGGSGSSMLTYSSSSDSWSGITDTSTAASLFSSTLNSPFMVFVTGPYASTNIPSGATATTLKATGSLIIGTKTYPTTGSQYTFIGNPYASPLSLTAMLGDADNSTNFNNGIWIWDSNGNTSVGSYNYFDKTAGAYSYNASSTPAATPILPTAEIQSGQAFFVQSSTATGTSFSIKEAHKGTSVINTVLRDAAPAQLLRVGLYKQTNSEWSGRDGAMTVILNDADANQTPNKMANGTENVAFTKNSGLFASNHHLPLVASDVLNVRVWNTTAGANYKLKINTEQFATTNLNATLEDLFTNSRTPLTLDGTAVEYPFAVTTEAASSGNRFRIVFENAALGIVNPKATGISILPNPITGDTFQVNLGTLGTGNYSYSICNALGQEVEKGSINNVAQNTNSVVKFKNNTAAGMYIIKVTGSDNNVFTAKIIKQ